MERSQIQLKTECIKNVPLNTYDKFCFIVNGEKYVTTRLVSDLLSPYISNIHMNDPTFDEFIINTKEKGHFSTILDLTNFNVNDLPTSEIPFISEVLEKLCNQSIELIIDQNNIELTNDNIFKYIKIHEKNKIFYSKFYFEEVKFISTHFYELCCKEKEKMKELDYETLKDIINNESLLINDEDQLISFINEICNNNFEYNDFYEYVNFTFVSVEEINKFIDKFDIDKMTEETWRSITKRLKHQVSIENDEIISTNKRYTKRKSSKTFHYETDKKFNGILNHIRSNYEIENEINITASSLRSDYLPKNVVLFEDQSKQFYTNNIKNSWICFDFKKRRVIPSHYTLMAHYSGQNGDHPKSWVIEGKNDNDKDNWEVIDEQKDSNYLNGPYYVHTFEINKEIKKEYQYIRMRLTGPNCSNCHEIKLAAFEFYGELIN